MIDIRNLMGDELAFLGTDPAGSATWLQDSRDLR